MKKIFFLILFPCFLQAQAIYVGNGATFYVKSNTSVKAVGSIENNGTVTTNGTLDFTQTLTNNGTLTGSGTVVAGTTWANGASSSIAPGNATTGTLNVTGDFAPSSSVLNIEIASVSDFDKFLISGAAILNTATLNVTLLNGFVPSGGDSFTILDAASLTGGFTTTSLPTLGGSISWSIAYNSGNGTATLLVNSVVLPIELLTFDGKVQGENVLLNWKTALEDNVKNFDIERSENGIDFRRIGMASPKGSNSNYDFLDENNLGKNNYYRLKINDLDNSFAYSNIIVVNIAKAKKEIRIYPTLVTDVVNIEYDIDTKIEQIQVIDAAGKLVYSFENTGNQIDLSELSSGMYFVQIKSADNSVFVGKIVKQ
jgi:trimeric autotransporter adhesin